MILFLKKRATSLKWTRGVREEARFFQKFMACFCPTIYDFKGNETYQSSTRGNIHSYEIKIYLKTVIPWRLLKNVNPVCLGVWKHKNFINTSI